MTKYFLVLATAVVLSGCAAAPTAPLADGGKYAWDGLGQDPNEPDTVVRQKGRKVALDSPRVDKPDANSERRKALATLRPYSEAWWAVSNEIEADSQQRMRERLVICRNCFPKGHGKEETASTSKRAQISAITD